MTRVVGSPFHLLGQVAADHPTVRKVSVDGGYRKHFVEHAATLGNTGKSYNAPPGAEASPR
ncbi:hypothetical protein RKD18_007962 [Streptomyces phaeoluteigriseus]